MPLIRIDIIEGRTEEAIRLLLDTIHEAVVEAFQVPAADRYQIVTEHRPYEMIILDTGLGFERTNDVVVISVTSTERSMKAKQLFYELVTEKLARICHIEPSDVMISIVTNSAPDWSFGFGRAQFLLNEL